MRKLILNIAISLDGFIAGKNDDLSFLDIVSVKDEDYGYAELIESIDTVIVGRKTFDWIVNNITEPPYPNLIAYVITKTPKTNFKNIIYFSNDLKKLVIQLKNLDGKNILCDGSAMIVNELLKNGLIDELIISIIPIILGEGIKLFEIGIPELRLKLVTSKSFQSGLVQMKYLFNQK